MGTCVNFLVDSLYNNCANRSDPVAVDEVSKQLKTGDLLFFACSTSWHLRVARPAPYSHVTLVYKEDDWSGLPKDYQVQLLSAGVEPGTPLLYEATGAPIQKQWTPLHESAKGPRLITLHDKLKEYHATEVGVQVGWRPLELLDNTREEFKQSFEKSMEQFKNIGFGLSASEAMRSSINCPKWAVCYRCFSSSCYIKEKADRCHCSSLVAGVFKEARYLPDHYSTFMYMPSDFQEWSSCICCCCLCWPFPLWMQMSELRFTKLADRLGRTQKLDCSKYQECTVRNLSETFDYVTIEVEDLATNI